MSKRPIEILIVEDNPGDVRLIRESLSDTETQHRLHVARDGEEALAYLHQEGEFAGAPRPELIILDLNLPTKNGHDVLAVIKSSAQFKFIPVVILTSSNLDEDILKAYAHNANCYVTKSVDPMEATRLLGAIRDFWLTSARLPVPLPLGIHSDLSSPT